MASIGDTTRPEYIYDQATDTWIPVGIGPHTHTTPEITNFQAAVDNNNILSIMGVING